MFEMHNHCSYTLFYFQLSWKNGSRTLCMLNMYNAIRIRDYYKSCNPIIAVLLRNAPHGHYLAVPLPLLWQDGDSLGKSDAALILRCHLISPVGRHLLELHRDGQWDREQSVRESSQAVLSAPSCFPQTIKVSSLLCFPCLHCISHFLFYFIFSSLFNSLLSSLEKTQECYCSLISSWVLLMWDPNQCDFVVYRMSGHLIEELSVCVERGQRGWIARIALRWGESERRGK